MAGKLLYFPCGILPIFKGEMLVLGRVYHMNFRSHVKHKVGKERDSFGMAQNKRNSV